MAELDDSCWDGPPPALTSRHSLLKIVVAFVDFEDRLRVVESPVSARAALLQALTLGPGYGLDLIERVAERTKGAVQLGQGSVYPALRGLEHEGFLSSREAAPEHGGRPRRYYKLTAKGVRAAVEQRKTVLRCFGSPPPTMGSRWVS